MIEGNLDAWLFHLDLLKLGDQAVFKFLNALGDVGVLGLALEAEIDHGHVRAFAAILLEELIF